MPGSEESKGVAQPIIVTSFKIGSDQYPPIRVGQIYGHPVDNYKFHAKFTA